MLWKKTNTCFKVLGNGECPSDMTPELIEKDNRLLELIEMEYESRTTIKNSLYKELAQGIRYVNNSAYVYIW